MRTYRSAAVADLAMQLERGPSRLCLRQLLQIEFLLSVVESEKSYPFDFVRHTLTGFRPRSGSSDNGSALIGGDALREDMVVLAEHISEKAGLPIESCREPLYSVGELAERFDVSTKTIFRWRQRGLVGWRFRFPDRRSRIAFPERCVRRFVTENSDLVVRGTSFSQLRADERVAIIEQARKLVAQGGKTVNSVAKVIAEQTGRAVETIRLILKQYDNAHPRAGIFNRPNLDVEPNDGRLKVWEAYVDGAGVEALAKRFGRSIPWIYRTITQMRARELKARKIDFVPSDEFADSAADEVILNDPDALYVRSGKQKQPRTPADLAPYLQHLFLIPLLTPVRERSLFRKFNYLKYKADRERKAVDPEAVKAVELDRIESLLTAAADVKREITQANLRLVVSIAKRHARPTVDFFEIISDGNMSLMKAVEKFDYSRGFKFSTYGSWAIMKNYARTIPEKIYHHDRYQTGREDYLDTVSGPQIDDHEDDLLPVMRSTLDSMLETLSDREQTILRQHFGLEQYGQTQTLEEIGRGFGVSKERIRQIESRAIKKLRGDFESEIHKLLGA